MSGFKSTERYIASRDLEVAVNAAVALQRPLLVKGEPGTGKTVLAHEVAASLGYPLVEWHVKSTTKAQQGLYDYDAVSRLRDSQLGDPKVADIANYIKSAASCGTLSTSEQRPVAADRRDRQGRHRVPQRPAARARSHGVLRLRDPPHGREGGAAAGGDDHLQQREGAARRPSCVAASSTTSASPTARRWTADRRRRIIRTCSATWLREALNVFYDRSAKCPASRRSPSTSELLDWLKLLMVEDMSPEALRSQGFQAAHDPAAARRALPQERAGTFTCSSVWPS